MTRAEAVWHVPVRAHEVPQAGARFSLEADAPTRAAVAATADVPEVSRLQAEFDVTPARDGGLRVLGSVSASVRQTCVVTLDPMVSEIDERVDLTFTPPAARTGAVEEEADAAEDRDTLEGGGVDLGALVVEFLILGIDPYPRKPGAVFTPPAVEGADEHPFAGLAALKRDSKG